MKLKGLADYSGQQYECGSPSQLQAKHENNTHFISRTLSKWPHIYCFHSTCPVTKRPFCTSRYEIWDIFMPLFSTRMQLFKSTFGLPYWTAPLILYDHKAKQIAKLWRGVCVCVCVCGWVGVWSEVEITALPNVGHRTFARPSPFTQQRAVWPQTRSTWHHIKSPVTSPNNPRLLGTYGERSCTVEVLRYKPEGRGFHYRCCHGDNPSGRTMVRWPAQPLIEMSTRNISWWGDKGGRCVGLTTLPPSRADCLEIWESQTPGTLRACQGLYRDCLAFY
jgi:hypothetical protein